MEEVTKKEEGKKATERPMDSALGRQPAPLSHQGETKATIPQKGAFQEPKVWGPGEAEAGAYCLQDEEALSIPGSAEEDEESEAVQAMALGLELQCRLQLYLDQLEAKGKAAAAARDSSEPALGACGSLTAPDCPQPLACQGSHGEPHIRAQELGAVLGQVPEEVKLGEKGGSESFGEPLWETGWYPREKGEIAAEAWGGLPTSNPTSVCQRRQLHPNLELKGKVPEGASTLWLTHENCSLRNTSSQKPGETLTPLGEQLESPIFAVPPTPQNLVWTPQEAEEALVYSSPPCSLSDPKTFASGGKEESQASGKTPAPGPLAGGQWPSKKEPLHGTEGLVPTSPQTAPS